MSSSHPFFSGDCLVLGCQDDVELQELISDKIYLISFSDLLKSLQWEKQIQLILGKQFEVQLGWRLFVPSLQFVSGGNHLSRGHPYHLCCVK